MLAFYTNIKAFGEQCFHWDIKPFILHFFLLVDSRGMKFSLNLFNSPEHHYKFCHRSGDLCNRLLSDSARSEPASDPVKPVIGPWLGTFVRASSKNVLDQFHCKLCELSGRGTVNSLSDPVCP